MAEALEGVRGKVLGLVLGDRARDLLGRARGKPVGEAVGGDVGGLLCFAAAYVLAVCAAGAVGSLIGDPPRGAAWWWIGICVILVLFLYGAESWTVTRLVEVGGKLDELIPAQERGAVVTYIEGRRPLRQQLWLNALYAAIGVGYTIFMHVHHHWVPEATSGLIAASAVTLFAIADVVVWLLRIPLIAKRLADIRSSLNVVQTAPATTPAFRDLSDFLGKLGIASAIGFVLFAVPLCWWTLLGLSHAVHPCLPHDHVPVQHSCERPWDLLWWSVVPLIVTVAINIYVIVISQLWVSGAIARQRDRVLDRIAGQHNLSEIASGTNVDEDRLKWCDLYDRIAAAAVQPPDAQTVLRKSLLIIGSAIPSLFLFVIRTQAIQQLFGYHIKSGG